MRLPILIFIIELFAIKAAFGQAVGVSYDLPTKHIYQTNLTIKLDRLTNNDATPSTVPYNDANKRLVSSTVTPTELQLLSGILGPLASLPITEPGISLSDVTTGDASATKHGWLPKLPNDVTKYLTGLGTYVVPPFINSVNGIGLNTTLNGQPTILDYSNAQHTHQSGTQGGTLDAAAIASGTIAKARLEDVSNIFQIDNVNASGTVTATGGLITSKGVIQSEVVVSGTVIDFSGSSIRYKTLSADDVFTFSNVINDKAVSVYVAANGHSPTWPSVQWDGGATPSASASGIDTWIFIQVNGTMHGSFLPATARPIDLSDSSQANGQLQAASVPAFTGDITTPGGSLATTLKATGTAGTYRSVTTDVQGRITAGTNPTTFGGYAISDSSANLRASLTDETGTGSAVFSTSPSISSPAISGSLTLSFANPSAVLTTDGSKNVSSVALPGDATKYLDGTGVFSVPPGTGGGGGGGGTNGMTIVNTNFVSGQLYTNNYGYGILVMSPVKLQTAAAAGAASMFLESSGNTTNYQSQQTTAFTDPVAKTNQVSCLISNGGTYAFTNRSSGGTNTATLLNGGQILYVATGTNGAVFVAYDGFHPVVNTNAETDLFSITIPANTLGTNKSVIATSIGQYFNQSLANRTIQIRVYFGGTKYIDGTTAVIGTSASAHAVRIFTILAADQNSASNQRIDFSMTTGAAGTPAAGYGALAPAGVFYEQGGTPLIDSTVDQVLRVTATLSNQPETTSYLNIWNTRIQ